MIKVKQTSDYLDIALISEKLKKLLRKSSTGDLNTLANALYISGEFEESKSVYIEAITNSIPTVSSLECFNKRYHKPHETLALSHFGLGEVLAAQGKVQESIDSFSEAYSILFSEDLVDEDDDLIDEDKNRHYALRDDDENRIPEIYKYLG